MPDPIFAALVTVVGFIAGGIASLAGFGIGSLLTPLLAAEIGTKTAVAVAALPHFAGTLLRLLLVRRHVDRRVLLTFGVTSAAGGLAGALLHVWFASAVLGDLLAALLVFAGAGGLTGLTGRMRFGPTTGRVAGAVSGIFGGLVGNQGGIRSAALTGFALEKRAFVATATAIALIVDVFRMPVYAVTQWRQVTDAWSLLVLALVGVVAGTVFGQHLLRRIPEPLFRRIVFALVLALGIFMFLPPAGRD